MNKKAREQALFFLVLSAKEMLRGDVYCYESNKLCLS